ncbi:MAG: restriction endonuclease subunit S [Roseobacter sp.]|uniref:restriction endonuclease subunit S n=1 Tax=Hyphomonas sp. TaxID=87 RepID=UPI003299D884
MSITDTAGGVKRVPALRFSEFEGTWVEKSLEDLNVEISDGNYGEMYPTQEQFVSDGVPFIRANNLRDGTIRSDDMRFISPELHEVLRSGHLKLSDILVTTRGDIGMVSFVPLEFVGANINAQLCLLRNADRSDQFFIFSYLNHHVAKRQFAELTTGSALKQLPRKNLKKVRIGIPSLPEQKKIAKFLGVVDAKIAALKARQEGLERYKRGLMQALFGQRLRFTKPDGTAFPDWEEKRLGEMFYWHKTNSLSREKLNYEDGEAQNIHYGDIHTKFQASFKQAVETVPYISDGALSKDIAEDELCKVGDLVIADASEDYEDIGKAIEIIELTDTPLVAGLHTYIARPKGDVVTGFSGYLFRCAEMRKQIMTIAQGVSVLGISKTNLEKLLLALPHPDEQQKIADALQAMDAKIAAVAGQVAKMEDFKKGLLQQMFV